MIEKITEDFYVDTEYMAPNVAVLRTQEGLVLFDSPCLPKDAKDWLRQIKENFREDIAYLINTDHHFDHMLGNFFFTRRTIAQEVALRGFVYYTKRENLEGEFKLFFAREWEEYGEEISKIEIVIPQVIFKNNMTLRMGNKSIILKYVGGHSPGTISIYIPQDKILIAGDNIENGMHPTMGVARFRDCLRLLREMEDLDINHVIPGHGEVGDKSLIGKERQYFEEYIRSVDILKKQGVSLGEMIPRITDHMMTYLRVDESRKDMCRMILERGVSVLFKELG
jgi:cyclase